MSVSTWVLICIQCVAFYLGGGGAHLHPVCHFLLGWGRGSFASSTVSLFVLRWGRSSLASSASLSTWVGEGLICIVHSVSLSIWVGEGLICIVVFLPLPWVEVGLICIIHNVTPFGWTTFQIKFLLFCLYLHCHCPQCVSLYFEWRKGRVSFTSSSVSHRLSGGEGGTHLHPPEVILCMIPPLHTRSRWTHCGLCK